MPLSLSHRFALASASVPVGLQFGQTPGAIQADGSRLLIGQNSLFSNFALVGGNVSLDGIQIITPGRRVELAGVGENGTVGLRLSGDRLSLNFAADTPRHDIRLSNAHINAVGSRGGGEVVVTGRNILLDRSVISTGILTGIDNAATNQAGDITINATANLQLTQNSDIKNLVNPNATGQGGNTRITASDIRVRDGSVIAVITFGNGNAGNIRVTANTIALGGTTPDGQNTRGWGMRAAKVVH